MLSPYAMEREARRRRSMGLQGLLAVALVAPMYYQFGIVGGLVFTVIVLGLIYGTISAIFLRSRMKELRRRSSGLAPSWIAGMPIRFVHELSPDVTVTLNGNAEALGRMSRDGTQWVWTANRRLHNGLTKISWSADLPCRVAQVPGPWRQGVIEFDRPNREPFDLWIRDPADLSRYVDAWNVHRPDGHYVNE